MNPLADTHIREGSLSMRCTEMKCEESDRSAVKVLCSHECGIYGVSARNAYRKSDHNTIYVGFL